VAKRLRKGLEKAGTGNRFRTTEKSNLIGKALLESFFSLVTQSINTR
jgi:hypothetical protein